MCGSPIISEAPALEQQRPVAEALDRPHVVRHEHHRAALRAQPGELVEALLLEGGVADGEHLVDQEDVGVHLDHHGEGEPHEHAGRVVLEPQVGELLELRELEHLVEPRAGPRAARAPAWSPLMITFSRAGSSMLKPTPSSMKVDTRPLTYIRPPSTA